MCSPCMLWDHLVVLLHMENDVIAVLTLSAVSICWLCLRPDWCWGILMYIMYGALVPW